MLPQICTWAIAGYVYFYLFFRPMNVMMGHLIPWSPQLIGPVTRIYSRLGSMVAGRTRSKFSLMLLAHISDGIPVFAWGVFAFLSTLLYLPGNWLGRLLGDLPEQIAQPLAVAYLCLPMIMFVFARNAARTVVCALCRSTANGLDGEKKAHDGYDLCYRKGLVKPCGFGQFFWPRTAPEPTEGEQESRPVGAVSGRIGEYAVHPDSPEEPNMQFEQPGHAGSYNKGNYCNYGGDSYSSQRNDNLFKRSGLEGVWFLRISGKAHGNQTDEKLGVSEKAGTESGNADSYCANGNAHQQVGQKMPHFVEKSMYIYAEETEGEFGSYSKTEEDSRNMVETREAFEFPHQTREKGVDNKAGNVNRNIAHRVDLLFTNVLYSVVLPFYAFALLFTAIRSRFEYLMCSEGTGVKDWVCKIFSFFAWIFSWPVEICATGATTVSLVEILARFAKIATS